MPVNFALTGERERDKETCRELTEGFATRATQHDEDRSTSVESLDDWRIS